MYYGKCLSYNGIHLGISLVMYYMNKRGEMMRKLLLMLFCSTLIGGAIYAQDTTVQISATIVAADSAITELDTESSKDDVLEKENEDLKRRLEALEKRVEGLDGKESGVLDTAEVVEQPFKKSEKKSVSDDLRDVGRALHKSAKNIGETIHDAFHRKDDEGDKIQQEEPVESDVDAQELNTAINNPSSSGFGGGGGPSFGYYYMDMEPVKYILDRERVNTNSALYGLGVNIKDREIFGCAGGYGFGGVGSGIRIGGGGWGMTETFSTYSADGVTPADKKIEISYGFGGLMIDKAFVAGKHTIVTGIMLAGGGVNIEIQKAVTSNGSIFSNESDLFDNSDPFDYEDGESIGDAAFGYFAGEFKLGYSYSLTSWMHLGAEGALQMSHTNSDLAEFNGFRSFSTINPGARLRLVFGNLG